MRFLIKGSIAAFFICISFMPGSSAFPYEIVSSLWQTEKSQHFVVYYQDAPKDYVSELISQAERYYSSIVENLGYRRFDFWNWDNRAKIYLYPDSSAYLADTQMNAWSGASVDIKKRTIKTFIGQKSFFSSMLPHEMAHIIFREFVGGKKALPLWIDEGVAGAQEEAGLKNNIRIARNLIKQNVFIHVRNLSEIRDYTLAVPQVFYAEASSLVFFLLERYGQTKFLEFSRQIRDGMNWDEALAYVYGLKDLDDFEIKWKEYYLLDGGAVE